jgi:guanyl-specific ribonuclease Sa
MSYPPKHLVPLSPINLLLMKARAARTQATRSRAIVAQLAALPVSNRASVSAAREHEEAAADNACPAYRTAVRAGLRRGVWTRARQ